MPFTRSICADAKLRSPIQVLGLLFQAGSNQLERPGAFELQYLAASLECLAFLAPLVDLPIIRGAPRRASAGAELLAGVRGAGGAEGGGQA